VIGTVRRYGVLITDRSVTGYRSFIRLLTRTQRVFQLFTSTAGFSSAFEHFLNRSRNAGRPHRHQRRIDYTAISGPRRALMINPLVL
jgi:hypothetical protein